LIELVCGVGVSVVACVLLRVAFCVQETALWQWAGVVFLFHGDGVLKLCECCLWENELVFGIVTLNGRTSGFFHRAHLGAMK
jgi:hypothetical protein